MSADRAAAVVDGALYLLAQPMALAVLMSVLLVARDLRSRDAALALALFAVAGSAALVLEPAAWHATFVAACLTALGSMCAAALRPGIRGLLAACAAGGLAVGLSGGLPVATSAEALGTIGAACLFLLVLHAGWQRASGRWLPALVWQMAPRVLAAWLAAIGLLMLALDLRP